MRLNPRGFLHLSIHSPHPNFRTPACMVSEGRRKAQSLKRQNSNRDDPGPHRKGQNYSRRGLFPETPLKLRKYLTPQPRGSGYQNRHRGQGGGSGGWQIFWVPFPVVAWGPGPEPPTRHCALLSSGVHNLLIACSSARRYQRQEEMV